MLPFLLKLDEGFIVRNFSEDKRQLYLKRHWKGLDEGDLQKVRSLTERVTFKFYHGCICELYVAFSVKRL